MGKRKNIRKNATLEVITCITGIKNAKKVERIDFDDCTYVARIGEFNTGQTVLVIRSGVKIPRELSKKVGIGRKLNNDIVDRVVLQGVPSDCIIIPLDKLPDGNPVKSTPAAFIGSELGNLFRTTLTEHWVNHRTLRNNSNLWTKIKRFFNAKV